MLDEEGIKEIETKYISNRAIENYNKKAIDRVLEGQSVDDLSVDAEKAQLLEQFASSGGARSLIPDEVDEKTWDEIFKDFEWNVEVSVTGEDRNVQDNLATFTTILKYVANDPAKFNLIFNKVLAESNAISPIEMQNQTAKQQIQEAQPQQTQLNTQQPTQQGAPIGGA